MKTLYVIDGNHLFYSLKNNRIEIDYLRLMECLTSLEGRPHKVLFYTGIDPANANADRQQKFHHWLRRNGFQVTQKATEINGQGNKTVDYKPELLADLALYGAEADAVVLLSGIEDYAYCMKSLGRRGVRTVVAAFEGLVSSKLLDEVDKFYNLKNYIAEIRKTTGPTLTPTPAKPHGPDWHEMDEDDFVSVGPPASPFHPAPADSGKATSQRL